MIDMSETKEKPLRIEFALKKSMKRLIVTFLIVVALAGEVVPEYYAKLVTVPALVSAILVESLVPGE